MEGLVNSTRAWHLVKPSALRAVSTGSARYGQVWGLCIRHMTYIFIPWRGDRRDRRRPRREGYLKRADVQRTSHRKHTGPHDVGDWSGMISPLGVNGPGAAGG